MKPGLVSAIVPVFNRAAMLGEAVGSVLGQTYEDVEVIIVDDGSTDETRATAQALVEANTGRVSLLSKANAGPGPARNTGLALARGEFVQYLDSDDLLEKHKFEWQVQALREEPSAGVAYGMTRRVNLRDGSTRIWAKTGEAIGSIFPGFLQARGWDTNSPLWRRSACDAIGPWADFCTLEDWEHDLRAGLAGVRVVQVEGHVATVRDHEAARVGSQREGYSAPILEGMFRAHRSVWRRMHAAGLEDWSYLEPFSRKVFWIARMCGEHGLEGEADEALAMAAEMVATRRYPWEMRRFRALKGLLGWRRAVAFAEAVRSPFRRGAG